MEHSIINPQQTMINTNPQFFFGCMLTDAQGDRILGIKAELVSANGRKMAELLYDGAQENFCCVLGNEFTHRFAGDLFIGDFLQDEADAEGRERIRQHLTSSLSKDRFNESRLGNFRLCYGADGEVESYEQELPLELAQISRSVKKRPKGP